MAGGNPDVQFQNATLAPPEGTGEIRIVNRGRAGVRDLRRTRTVTLTAGKRYLAEAGC